MIGHKQFNPRDKEQLKKSLINKQILKDIVRLKSVFVDCLQKLLYFNGYIEGAF